ncbi:hypothetical protein ACSFC1_00360 [Pseudothermotoga sp. U03pept]|uniref:hypothetical protein n=1 Tax=Pseudothermotoga sp. U03pept TaxID=3447012 RepID=UPI003EFD3D35
MEEEKDERILNLLRLKMEMEKDLQKKGIKPKEQPKKDVAPSKVKLSFEEDLNIPVQDIRSLYDLNYYTYGESDSLIYRSIHKRLMQVEEGSQRLFLQLLEQLLQGDFSKKGCFGQKSEYFDAIDLTMSLYGTQRPPFSDVKRLLTEYPSSTAVLLSVAEVLLFAGRYREAAKVFKISYANSQDPYLGILTEAYETGQINSSLLTGCISRGGYKLLVLLVSALLESEERSSKIVEILDKKSYACAKYIACKEKRSKSDEYPFCPRISILNQAIDYTEMGTFERDLILALSDFDPMALILLLSESVRRKDVESAKKHLSNLINSCESVGFVPLSRGDLPVCLRGVLGKQFSSKVVIGVDDPEEGVKKLFELVDRYGDVQIVYRDIEFLRLYYGERHCRNLYRRV